MSKKLLTKIIIAGVFMVIAIPLTMPVVMAQTRREAVAEKKDELTAKKCERVQDRGQKVIDKINQSHTKRTDALSKLETGLNKAVERAKKEGLDTTKVEADILNVIKARKELISLNGQAVAALAEVKSIQCGEKKGDHGTKVKEAIQKQNEYKKVAKENLKKALETLRADLKELKSQKVKVTPSAEQ